MEPETRNKLIAALCGVLFALGWFIFLDGIIFGQVHLSAESHVLFAYCIPGIVVTLSFFAINAIQQSVFYDQDDLVFGGARSNALRFMLFFSLFTLFGSMIGALVVFVVVYGPLRGNSPTYGELAAKYPGVAIVLHSLLVGASTLLFKFGRVDPDAL